MPRDIVQPISGGSTGGSTAENTPQLQREPFALRSNGLIFAPRFPPSSFSYTKDRNLFREKNLCEGEDVDDGGSKNREVRVSGYMRQRERLIFEDVLDHKDPFLLITRGWSGEVRVGPGNKYQGPIGIDEAGELLWRYTIVLVSTGKDEYDDFSESGIIE